MNTHRLTAAILSLAAAGCRCGGGTAINKPDFTAMPTAVQFSACPTKDEMQRAVADVFPDEQKVTIQNQGKAPGVLEATLSGPDSAQFKLDPMRTPKDIAPGATETLPIQFSPVKKGDAKATLTLDDGDAETAKITVDLIGTGKNLPSQPTIEAALEDYAAPGMFTQVCKEGSTGLDCQQGYPDTLLKDSSTLKIKLRNKGCPALKITGIDLVKGAGGADNMAFFISQPTTLPSTSNPLVMSTADGTSEVTLLIRFAPESDGSGDSQRFADLTITSNDPATPTLRLSLQGNGIEPAVYAVPSFCNYNDSSISCRPTGAKVPNEAVFDLINGGTAMVKIDSALFKSTNMNASGSGGRFTVQTPVDGQMLAPGAKASLIVRHSDMPLFVVDQITVSASVPGMPAGSAGKVFLTVAGGTAPCLKTEPDTSLDYDMPTDELTVKQVTVKALATAPGTNTPCGDLIVEGAEIPTNPFFSVVEPKIMANTRITAGQQAQIHVQYKKPVTGGRQASDLVIRTNDLAFGPPSYKTMLLQSSSPLNQIPVCVLKGCTPAMTNCSAMGATTSMGVSLSSTFGGGPKVLTLWGGDSYDPGNPNMPGIAQWKFQVSPPSPNVSGYSVTGGNMYTSMNSQTLTLDPTATGQYRAFLYVKDDSGQQSGLACELRISVTQ